MRGTWPQLTGFDLHFVLSLLLGRLRSDLDDREFQRTRDGPCLSRTLSIVTRHDTVSTIFKTNGISTDFQVDARRVPRGRRQERTWRAVRVLDVAWISGTHHRSSWKKGIFWCFDHVGRGERRRKKEEEKKGAEGAGGVFSGDRRRANE